MDDALLVSRLESFGDLRGHRQRLVERNGTAGDPLREIVALDQLHNQRGEEWCFLEAIDRPDVRMVEGREHFGFTLKARETLRIATDRGGEHFDGHRPLQIAVDRAIDLAHAASANLRRDVVDAETGARSEGQGLRLYGRKWASVRGLLGEYDEGQG